MLFLFPGSFSNSYVYFYIVIFVCLKLHATIRSTNLRFKNVQNQSLGVFQESCRRKRWRCPSHDFLDPFKFFFLRLCDLWQRKTYSFRRVCVAQIGYFSKISTSFGDKIKKKTWHSQSGEKVSMSSITTNKSRFRRDTEEFYARLRKR